MAYQITFFYMRRNAEKKIKYGYRYLWGAYVFAISKVICSLLFAAALLQSLQALSV